MVRKIEEMKHCFITILVIFIASDLLSQYESKGFSTAGFYQLNEESGRHVYSFNNGWYFYKGDIKNAEKLNYKLNNNWKQVQLPHGIDILPQEASGGISYQGIVWYRKSFKIPSAIVNKKIKPIANNKGVLRTKTPFHNVANQLKTLIPVGTAIIIVAAVK